MSPEVIALLSDFKYCVIWSPLFVVSELVSVAEVLLEVFGACERILFNSVDALEVSPDSKSLSND